jgi:hypothetical protein
MKYINFNPGFVFTFHVTGLVKSCHSLCVNGRAFSADWQSTEHTSGENVRLHLEKLVGWFIPVAPTWTTGHP